MQIGQLARAAATTVETVRYYERSGLLPTAARSQGNFRRYGPEHLERLRFIRNCRALNMSHEEIRELLRLADHPDDGCGAVNRVFNAHIAHVDQRIRELNALREQLQTLSTRCGGASTTADCAILQGLAQMPAEPSAAPSSHLG